MNSLPLYTWTAVRTTALGVQPFGRIEESDIIAEVISQNYSFISVITITSATSLQGSIICCDGYKGNLNISSISGE